MLTILSQSPLLVFEWSGVGESFVSFFAKSLNVVGMENARPKIVGLHVVQRQSGVLKRHAICVNGFSIGIQDDDGLRNSIRHAPKFFFILAELSFGALKVIDVRIRSIPVDNVARFVAQWLSPKQEPSIHSVESAQPTLDFARLASGQESEPFICYFLQVLRMNGILPSPAASHFKWYARIFLPSPVPKYSRTIRQATPRECRDRVDDLPESRFRVPDLLIGASQCFLRSLSFDGDYGDVTCAFDQPQVSLTRGAGLCVVHSKGAEHVLVFGK